MSVQKLLQSRSIVDCDIMDVEGVLLPLPFSFHFISIDIQQFPRL